MIQKEMKRMKLHVVVSSKLSHFESSQRRQGLIKKTAFQVWRLWMFDKTIKC